MISFIREVWGTGAGVVAGGRVHINIAEARISHASGPPAFPHRGRPALDALQGSPAAWYASAMAALISP